MSDIDNAQKVSEEPSLNEILSSIKRIIDDDLDGKEAYEQEVIGIDEVSGFSEDLEDIAKADEADESIAGESDEDGKINDDHDSRHDDVLTLTEVFADKDDNLEDMSDIGVTDADEMNNIENMEVSALDDIIQDQAEDTLESDLDPDNHTEKSLQSDDATNEGENHAENDEHDNLNLSSDNHDEQNNEDTSLKSQDHDDINETDNEVSVLSDNHVEDDFDLDDIGFFDVEEEKDETALEAQDSLDEVHNDTENVHETDNTVDFIQSHNKHDSDSDLISEETNKLVGSTFKVLTDTLLTHQGKKSLTIEEIVQEMLRPIMKQWLDSHLPKIVEKMVKEEISRVTKSIR